MTLDKFKEWLSKLADKKKKPELQKRTEDEEYQLEKVLESYLQETNLDTHL